MSTEKSNKVIPLNLSSPMTEQTEIPPNNSNGMVALDSFPVSSQDDFISLEKSSTKSRLLKVLVFGLCLYLLDIGLHVAIASHYLQMRDCHRGVQHTIEPFVLKDLVKINNNQKISHNDSSSDQGVQVGFNGQ